MPRPVKYRTIGQMPVYRSFSSDDVADAETVRMSVDEFETIKLLDGNGLTQEECAARMHISRTTVTAIYNSARKKVADMLVNGKQLLIVGGCCAYEPLEMQQKITGKGTTIMRIAVTYQNGEVFQHFGQTEQFKLYDVDEGKIVNEQIVDTNGVHHGALAGFLKAAEADVLLCGGIGAMGRAAVAEVGIRLYPGVEGPADEAAKAFLTGTLQYDPDAHCDHNHAHHGEGHACGHHHGGDCGHHHEDGHRYGDEECNRRRVEGECARDNGECEHRHEGDCGHGHCHTK
ncbi:MAG: DUF134 domain-containing protein [Clostridia bacterium]|nr:DUF134 domain-containing protein [Clostridia bacterium]